MAMLRCFGGCCPSILIRLRANAAACIFWAELTNCKTSSLKRKGRGGILRAAVIMIVSLRMGWGGLVRGCHRELSEWPPLKAKAAHGFGTVPFL